MDTDAHIILKHSSSTISDKSYAFVVQEYPENQIAKIFPKLSDGSVRPPFLIIHQRALVIRKENINCSSSTIRLSIHNNGMKHTYKTPSPITVSCSTFCIWSGLDTLLGSLSDALPHRTQRLQPNLIEIRRIRPPTASSIPSPCISH